MQSLKYVCKLNKGHANKIIHMQTELRSRKFNNMLAKLIVRMQTCNEKHANLITRVQT